MKPRTRRRQGRVGSLLLAGMLCSGLALAAGPGSATQVVAISLAGSTSTASAISRTGTGAFSSLHVTVDRTKNLIDQVVKVDWSGSTQTTPDSSFGINYLQVMQCWGDAASGPTPQQCEFGGKAAFDTRGGNFSATRQINYPIVDPLQALPARLPASGLVYVPFKSVTAPTVDVDGNANQFYDASTTNEVPYARTQGNGQGQLYFETQTAQEAPGLGCGASVNGKPRSCWLVVVPRNDREVDGSLRDVSNTNQLQSSPLSATNWKNRLVFPLSFAPVGDVCPIGAAEHRTVGIESVKEAVIRWQPALCANGGPVYGYSQVIDAVANRQTLDSSPALSFVSQAIPTDQISADRPLTYAPVTLSGLTISFLIESQSGPNAPPAVKAVDGQRISSLNLTARLVAKLLTQSYRLGVNANASYLKDNPADLTRDPEFLALNPSFKALRFATPIADILVPEALTGANSELWSWLGSNAAARDFLSGQPDPWGMRINPFYQGTSTGREDFPKIDPYCQVYPVGGPAPLCTLDAHPYSSDMHEAARAASRGDALARSAWDPYAIPPAYKKAALQLSGRRELIAFSDTATAARFGLTPANLQNADGQFVAPTDTSLVLGAQAMTQSSVPGVLAPSPGTHLSGAYPLTTLTYAVIAPTALSATAANDYANLIRYGVGAGQVPGINPGQLPDGYVPLPQSLRAQALTSATIIQERKGGTPPAPVGRVVDASGGTSPSSDSGGSAAGGSDSAGGSNGSGGAAGTDASTTASGALSTGKSFATSSGDSSSSSPTASGVRTPKEWAGGVRYVLPIVLVLGSLAAVGGPALPLARRRMRRTT
jgi:uncharacterized membrane protein YgcG